MDIIVYSHLRWNFVYQRPQHLLSRLAQNFRVLFIEEPIFGAEKAYLDNQQSEEKVWVIVPHLPHNMSAEEIITKQNELLRHFLDYFECKEFIAWYYTPMALGLNPDYKPTLIIFDCMDELSAFKNAPTIIKEKEEALINSADLVFTGGYSLYMAKKNKHNSVHLFPSSIDAKHFNKARRIQSDPIDQLHIPHPRIGFFGVVDERMDIDLLDQIAAAKPNWHFVIIGPVVKIDASSLPRHANIHYLGAKTYKELPDYIAGWDVAAMPFAINESTKFISPTKTPEYLAAGKPVVSTAIYDVVKFYGDPGLVYIADSAEEFETAIERALDMPDVASWQKVVDLTLAENSWDNTVEKMLFLINTALELKKKKNLQTQKEDKYV